MPLIKVWTMKQVNLNTGETKESPVNVPCSVKHYIRAINMLNQSAHIYGVVYLPSDDDDYNKFVNE